jgi:multicomponent Na+:H+ antiporter subunit D
MNDSTLTVMMMEMFREHLLIIPIMLLLFGAICAALAPGRIGGIVVTVVAGVTLAFTFWILQLAMAGEPLVYQVGGWAPPQGIVLVADRLSALLALIATLLALASSIYTLTSRKLLEQTYFHVMFLLLLMALLGVFFTGDLFNLYVFMEMVILSSVILVALADRPVSAEVTFKYTILSALGSTALLFGIGLIYGAMGTLNMAEIALHIHEGPTPVLIPFGAAMLLMVFLLKAGIVPFHFWLPDAHSAAPAAVSAMLSGMLVKVGVYGVLRMATLLFPGTPALSVVAWLGAASALFGGLAALANGDLKRLLAYSTIANVGLIMMAIGWGGQWGLMAAIVHMVNHALFKGGLFLAGGYLAERYHEHSLRRLTGFANLTPGIAVVFGIGAVALAGLPPTGGFVSKLMLIQAGWLDGAGPLWLVAIIASGLSIAYSIRLFIRLLWGATPAWAVALTPHLPRQRLGGLAAALLVAGVLLLGILPSLLTTVAGAAAAEILDPQIYIHAVLGGLP